MDGHYCTAYPGRAERSQPPGYGLVLSLRTGLVPRSMQRVTHSPVNSGSLVVNNTACCSASSSSLLSSTTGPIALVTSSRRSPVSRPALRTPRDLFSYRSFRKSRGILAWKFASLSLSTDFYIYVKSHSQFLVDLRQLYRLINFEKKGKYWKSLDRYQRDLSFDHPRRGRKSRNDVDKWICRKRVFDAEDDTKVERS